MRKALIAALALTACAARAEPVLTSDFSFTLPPYGGFSAIEVEPDGTGFAMLSDKGVFVRGAILRSGDTITGLSVDSATRLHDPRGRELDGKNSRSDTEGLALRRDGSFVVSLEGKPRVWHFDSPTANAAAYSDNPAFASLQPNSGLEALAMGPDGTLYTIPERSGRYDTPFPVYRYGNGWDVAFTIPRIGSFLVTGADIGPDGRFYVLERDFIGVAFRSRVRRFDMDGTNETLLLETGYGTHGNLEGISVWADNAGALRMTLVLDNNMSTFISSRMIEYRLDN